MEELPFKYLGVPLSTKKMTVMQWYPLIEKIMARITSWTARKLSYAGRAQLVQTVLFGVQAYWAQLFLIPAKVIKVIDSMCRSYLWSGAGKITRKAFIAWEKVCRPKNVGDGADKYANMEWSCNSQTLLGFSKQRRQVVDQMDTYILYERAG